MLSSSPLLGSRTGWPTLTASTGKHTIRAKGSGLFCFPSAPKPQMGPTGFNGQMRRPRRFLLCVTCLGTRYS